MFFNANRGKNTPSKKAWDFVPFIRQTLGNQQDPDQMKGLLMSLVKETDPHKPKEVQKKVSQTKRYKKRMRQLKENQGRK